MGDDLDHILLALDDPSVAKQSHEHIVERINMSFDVQNAILNAPNLTRFKVSGHLPELQLNFSDRKYSESSPLCITLTCRIFDEVHRCRDSQVR